MRAEERPPPAPPDPALDPTTRVGRPVTADLSLRSHQLRGEVGRFRFQPRRVATYAEQLESVQSAIAAIEARGQAYTIDGRSLTRADLATLYEREQWLRGQAAREARGGGMRVRLGVPRSS